MRFTAKDIAIIAVIIALLLGGQTAFSMVSGVEPVTALLLCFCYSFGIKRGMLAATAFSLLRCFIWGVYPAVIVLYLVYYNAFALLFGCIGRRAEKNETDLRSVAVTEMLFAVIFTVCICFLTGRIKISLLLVDRLRVLSWAVLSVTAAYAVIYNALLIFGNKFPKLSRMKRLIYVTVAAAVCTVCFSLLDDIITPLFYGYTEEAALAYFYTSFTVIIPQTLCVVITVSALFFPLTKIFSRVAKSIAK